MMKNDLAGVATFVNVLLEVYHSPVAAVSVLLPVIGACTFLHLQLLGLCRSSGKPSYHGQALDAVCNPQQARIGMSSLSFLSLSSSIALYFLSWQTSLIVTAGA